MYRMILIKTWYNHETQYEVVKEVPQMLYLIFIHCPFYPRLVNILLMS